MFAESRISVVAFEPLGRPVEPQRDPVGSESLVADWTPTGSGIDAVVSAFDEATGKILKQLVAWTLRAGQRAMR